MKMKTIVIVAVMVLATGVNAQAARSTAARSASAPYQAVQTDAHKPVTYHFAVTNTTDKPQTVESVRTSCACLKVMSNVQCAMRNDNETDGGARRPAEPSDAIPPGGVLPFDVELNPAGMEGPVEKRLWVTLAPMDGSPGTARPTRIVTFDIAADVRLRLGFKPMDAAFGVIKRSETGREIVAKLAGYVADEVTLGTPVVQRNGNEQTDLFAANAAHDSANAVRREQIRVLSHPDNPANPVEERTVFNVLLGADGKSVVAKFCDRDVLPGIYAETWTIPTSDAEIPEIKFTVSARVADALSVTPQVITVGWDEPVCSRMVMVRDNSSRKERKERKEVFSVLSAETKPRKWGDVKIAPRPMNGWRIDIENIDPREVRQFSKRPFLEVKTNLPGMETFEIPLRVVHEGATK